MILKESRWETSINKYYPKLTESIETDVVIVGAGITGIFNAYLLSRAGLSVVVLEKNEKILQSATLYTTALITKIIDSSLSELVSIFGSNKARLVWQSGQEAINLIADIVNKEHIDCEFGFVSAYTYASNGEQFKKLAKEYETIKKLGFEANLQKDGSKLNVKNSGYLEIPNQAKFHPVKFANVLANLAEAAGVKFFTDSEVMVASNQVATTKAAQVKAKDIIIATYSPLTDEGTRFKKAMYVSYVYELEMAKNVIPEALYLDMQNPYHYFRIDSYEHFDRMIVGGEDHRKDIKVNPEKCFGGLQEYIKTVLEGTTYNILREWRGNILESVDGLPFIGAISPHIFVATAFSGNGMTYAPISGTMICNLILRKNNYYVGLYDPKRRPTIKQLGRKGFDYAGEFFGGAVKNFFSSKKNV